MTRSPPPQESSPESLPLRNVSTQHPAHRKLKRRLYEEAGNKILQIGDLKGAKISGYAHVFDDTTNLSPSILSNVDRDIYLYPNHPICITRKLIESVFPPPIFRNYTARNPVVTTHENFDVLGFPEDHPGRARTDTYYVNKDNVLRTHTSAHQHAAFQHISTSPEMGYTICADVYRRDSIDRSHYPVFHQMEGARLWKLEYNRPRQSRFDAMTERKARIMKDVESLIPRKLYVVEEVPCFDRERNPPQLQHDEEEVRFMVRHLQGSLELLVDRIFAAAKSERVGSAASNDEPLQIRWVEAYFPFTSPSFELEVFWKGDWLELLGCGIVKQSILNNADLKDHVGWAWGIGVERLAMLLFDIPDIRLFWSRDTRFLNQFHEGRIKKFKQFSKYPPCYKDIAFWITPSPAAASPVGAESDSGVAAAAGGDATKASPASNQPDAFHENDIMEIVRDVAGSLVEDVKLLEEFVHPTSGRKSLCYRINYRSLETTLTNAEVNKLHDKVAENLTSELGVELR